MRSRPRLLIALACLVLTMLAGAMPARAAARQDDPLTASGPDAIELSRVDACELPIVCDPATIRTGVSCGMTDMCGEDPCLCGGAVDAWGMCACNGLVDRGPDFSLAGGEGTVALLHLFDRWWLVPLGSGSVTVQVTASYPHHVPATVPLRVEVAGFGVLDALKLLLALAVAAGVVIALVLAVCALARGVRKLFRIIRHRIEEARTRA